MNNNIFNYQFLHFRSDESFLMSLHTIRRFNFFFHFSKNIFFIIFNQTNFFFKSIHFFHFFNICLIPIFHYFLSNFNDWTIIIFFFYLNFFMNFFLFRIFETLVRRRNCLARSGNSNSSSSLVKLLPLKFHDTLFTLQLVS